MALYVHAICGFYSWAGYRQKARTLWQAGFIRCKGRRQGGGRWEIWALTTPNLARGPISGMTEADIIVRLNETIQPGSIEQAHAISPHPAGPVPVEEH